MTAIFGNVEILLITDPYYLEKELADDAAAIAMGIAQTIIQAQYVALAQDYQNLYQREWDFYNTQFQIGGEAPLVTQVFTNPLGGNGQFGQPFYTPQYTAQWNNINSFNATGGFSSSWWGLHAGVYNDTILNFSYDPLGNLIFAGEPVALDTAATVDDADSYLYRYEEHRKDVYDERSWEWQNQALNFGVKQASVVESGLATSFKYMDEASTNLADWFATQSNGLAQYSGYRSAQGAASSSLRDSARTGAGLTTRHQVITPGADLINNGRNMENIG